MFCISELLEVFRTFRSLNSFFVDRKKNVRSCLFPPPGNEEWRIGGAKQVKALRIVIQREKKITFTHSVNVANTYYLLFYCSLLMLFSIVKQ